MSTFRDTIAPNDFKEVVFAGDDFCEEVIFRQYPATQARATGNMVGGEITSITVDGGGSGYLSEPTYSVSGSGSTLTLDAITITDGVITGITIAASSDDWTGPATITFSGGGSDTAVQAVVIREGIQKVNGRHNIYGSLRLAVSALDVPTIDTGRDCFVVKKKMDESAEEMRIANVLTQNSALWILALK